MPYAIAISTTGASWSTSATVGEGLRLQPEPGSRLSAIGPRQLSTQKRAQAEA
jgi:hypothetical protein